MGRLLDKVAVITGAAGGIGTATAIAMSREGAAVVLADIDGVGATEVTDKIIAAGGRAVSIRVDVTSEADVVAMLDLAESTFGRIDVLHNNAGAIRPDDLDIANTPIDAWRYALEVNLLGVVVGIRNAVPRMAATGGGSILNTASTGSFQGNTSLVAYAAAKAGVLSLTKHVATSHGRVGIRCNAIAPGLVLKPGAREHFPVPALLDAIARHQPLAGFTSPDDVAELAVFLGSDSSRFVTGQTFVIDAGATVMAATVPRIDELLSQRAS